ncbi:unnamed protein product [Effrenium voratum]|nr:unnamed protein product [Effrenium voratum]
MAMGRAKDIALKRTCEELRVSEHLALAFLAPEAWLMLVSRCEDLEDQVAQAKTFLRASVGSSPGSAVNAALQLAALGRRLPTLAEDACEEICNALPKLQPLHPVIEAFAALMQSLPPKRRPVVLKHINASLAKQEGFADLLELAFGSWGERRRDTLPRCMMYLESEARDDNYWMLWFWMRWVVPALPERTLLLLKLREALEEGKIAAALPLSALLTSGHIKDSQSVQAVQAVYAAFLGLGGDDEPLLWLAAARFYAFQKRRCAVDPLQHKLRTTLQAWLAAPCALAHRPWRDLAACEFCGLALTWPQAQFMWLEASEAETLLSFLQGKGNAELQRSARPADTTSALCIGLLLQNLKQQQPACVTAVLKTNSLLCASISALAAMGGAELRLTSAATALTQMSGLHVRELLQALASLPTLPDLRLGVYLRNILESQDVDSIPALLQFIKAHAGADPSLAALWLDIGKHEALHENHILEGWRAGGLEGCIV